MEWGATAPRAFGLSVSLARSRPRLVGPVSTATVCTTESSMPGEPGLPRPAMGAALNHANMHFGRLSAGKNWISVKVPASAADRPHRASLRQLGRQAEDRRVAHLRLDDGRVDNAAGGSLNQDLMPPARAPSCKETSAIVGAYEQKSKAGAR